MKKQVLTSGEAAKICGVNFRTILRWVEKGILKAHKLPGRGDTRIQIEDLVDFLNQNNMPIPDELVPKNKVLIVDDDPSMTATIQRIVKREGFETLIANNGFEAGTALTTFQPHIVTLDLKMPGVDGFQVIKHMRETLKVKTQILVISAASKQDLQKAVTCGANQAIAKPFDNEELLSIIKSLSDIDSF